MKKYESIVIIDPKLKENEIKETIEKYRKMMNEFSNKEVNVEDMGEKKLAYEIKKNSTGYFTIFNFTSEPQNIAELERNYRIDDNVIKFITVLKEEQVRDESEEEDEEEY